MKLFLDDELIAENDNINILFNIRNEKIKETLFELEVDNYIDKYAIKDWLFGLDGNREKEFFLNEGPGYLFKIISGE